MTATTGQLYELSERAVDDSTYLTGPYSYPASLSTLAVKKLLPHSLLLLENGLLHPTSPLSSLPTWLSSLLADWNKSEERSTFPITDLHLGTGHLIALTTTGTVLTAGDNADAQRGLGHRHGKTAAVSLLTRLSQLPGSEVTAIAAGDEHCLALTSIGDVYGWGRNVEGQLFTAVSTPFMTSPTYLGSLRGASVVKVGCKGRYSVCLDSLGRLWYAGDGVLRHNKPSTPQPLPCPDPIAAFALGSTHILALASSPSTTVASPTVYVLGNNLFHQLGLPSVRHVNTLTPLPSFTSPITGVYAGPFSSFFLSHGQLFACGSNQGAKLGLTSHPETPQPIQSVSDKCVEAVECESNRTRVWVPTRVSGVEPAWVSASGGVGVRVEGVGLFAHSFPLSVRFTYLTVVERVEATFDVIRGGVKCIAPPLPPVVVPTAASPVSVERCEVQVSVDSIHWSPSYPIYVYTPPSFTHASFYPRGTLHTGGSRVQLRVELDPMPYPAVRVRLSMGEETCEVDGQWEAALNQLTWVQPAWEGVGQVKVAVSFNGLEWHEVQHGLTAYRMEGWKCSRESLSVVPLPTPVGFHVQGCVLHDRVKVRFTVVDRSEEFTVDARWVGELEARLQARAEEVEAEEKEQRERLKEDDLRARVSRSEDEKDEEEKKREEERRQRREAALAQEDGRRAEERRQRYEEEDAAWAALSAADRVGRGSLECITPSFIHIGPCHVSLSVCVNEVDWHHTGLVIKVEGPRIDRLVPDCAPITGDTKVEVIGDGLFNADEVTVALTNPRPLSPSSLASSDTSDENKLKANRMAPAPPVKPSSTPKGGASKAEAVAPSTPSPAVTPPTIVPASFSPTSASVWFTAPACGAGVRVVGVTLSSTTSMHPSMSSVMSIPFTFYQPPTFTELLPQSFLPHTPQEASLCGKGLFPTSHALIKLTVRDDPTDLKPIPAKAKSKAEDEVKAIEEPVARTLLSVTVVARVRMEEEEGMRSPKGKSGAKGKVKEEGVGALLLTVPMAGVGWQGVEEGEERKKMEEMIGKVVEISVAMDGQHFLPTGLTLKYEREVKVSGARKPSAVVAPKKK